jgi:hypothetical protein
MRARRLILGAAAAGAALVGPLGVQAGADDRDGQGGQGRGSAYINGDGDPTAAAAEAGSEAGGGGGGGESPCTWSVFIEDDFVFHVYETEGVELHSATGRWLSRACERPAANGVTALDMAYLPEGGLVDPEALALQALESVSVPEPVIGTSPPAGDLVVHVPTWLWVSGGWWDAYSATASAGRVTSTVTVAPTQAVWTSGDGMTTTCTGPGVAWAPGLPEHATDCSHTYTSPSDGERGGTFELSVTVELDVSWSSNTGAGGVLPAMSREVSEAVRVGEIQAIETG